MDQQRYDELKRKRTETGLTREEADELGRMMAEEAGKPYSNADAREHPDSLPRPESMPLEGATDVDSRPEPRKERVESKDEEAKDVAR